MTLEYTELDIQQAILSGLTEAYRLIEDSRLDPKFDPMTILETRIGKLKVGIKQLIESERSNNDK